MNRRSFRLRIALLSAALAGSALVGFGIAASRLIYVAIVKRLDAKLESQVIRATRPRIQGRWQAFEAALPAELGTDADTSIALLVLSQDGKILYQSKNWSSDFRINSQLNPYSDRRPNESSPMPQIVTQSTSTGSWRIASVNFPPAQAAIAVNLQAIDQEMAIIHNIFLVVISGTLLLVAGGAWGLSGSALKPIDKLTVAIRQVTVAGLDQQVPIETTDVEFIELIQVFNQMLERLGRSFKQASRFSADAAHELKTPLAILQGELERTLQQAEPESAIQQSLSTLLDEVRRLSEIVRKLLLLSLADAGQMNLHKVQINLSEMLTVMVEDMELIAPHLDVQSSIEDDLYMQGDLDLLTQLLHNLLSNAVKYNRPNGWLRIEAKHQEAAVSITIANASNDISDGDRDRIFDRFYRGDPAHTRKIEGVGLGLSLSREIARAHNGDLTLDHTPSGQTAFTLTL